MVNTKAIKKRMIELGMSNNELAEAVGRTPQHVSGVVNGRKPMTLKMAFDIQEALDIPNSEFDYYFLQGND